MKDQQAGEDSILPQTTGGRRGKRVSDLEEVQLSVPSRKPVDPTPDEARALIDSVFRSYGLDPREATDAYGWRYLSLGSAQGSVGVVEWQPGQYHLVVRAAVLRLPPMDEQLCDFYRWLLELNYDGTLSARFSVHDDIVGVGLSRPIRGLNEVEVHDAIRAVMVVADSYDEWLQETLDRIQRTSPLPFTELPDIELRPKDTDAISTVLGLCDPHGRDVFRYLMEQWQKADYIVSPGTSGIGLTIPIGGKRYGLAGMRPGVGERRQLLILGWEGLRNRKAFPNEAVDRYQSAVERIANLHITESNAHIEVTETFDRASAKALLGAMRTLARSVQPELAEEDEFAWDPSLPMMEIQVGSKTLAKMQRTLQACEPRVQQLYATLIEGWNQAGGTVQCSRAGRIYLKFQSREHEFGEYGRQSHKFNLAVLAAPKGKRGPSIGVTWDLAKGEVAYLDYVPGAVADFEAAVRSLPGFERVGTVTRLVIDRSFQPEHAQMLLDSMLKLREAGGKESQEAFV
jgi:hypothetical protein